jgi:transglutaminase superfamily protein
MRFSARIGLISIAVALGASLAAANQNLLLNGGFESGGRGPAPQWNQIYPPSIQNPPPQFTHPKEAAHRGKYCVQLQTSKPGGYSSFTQSVSGPKGADLAQLSAWVRVDEMASGSAASLLLLFSDAQGEMISLHRSRSLSQAGEWQQLSLEVQVPDGAVEWMVRCGVLGQGTVAFDDVVLTAENLKGDFYATELAVHHGDYLIRTSAASKAPWVALSIPFPFEGQSPLALRVTSDPPGMVARLDIFEQRENRPLRVTLKPTQRNAQVKLRIETLTMVRDRPLSEGLQVALAKRAKVPKEVRQHLQAAPGVDSSSSIVREAAQGFDKSDFGSLMNGISDFLNDNLKYSGGRSQGAEECLEDGSAVCTGYANVAAALLIAAEVPTRILACTQLSGRLQEHYIVEAWTPQLGWSRLESTMARFPWKDSANLIIRVVYPDSNRSSIDVPIFVQTGGGASGGFDLGADTCWQGADPIGSFLVPEKGFLGIEKHTRKAFAALVKGSAKGHVARFAPDAKQAKKLKLEDRSSRLIEAVDQWLEQQ